MSERENNADGDWRPWRFPRARVITLLAFLLIGREL
jgi:hypothetical protein